MLNSGELARRGLLRTVLSGSLFALGGTVLKAESAKPEGRSGRPSRQPWLTLPATPDLPHATNEGLARLDNTSVWFAQFGKGPDVLMLHGGMANSKYWGLQVAELASEFRITVMDTRGHGRSPLAGTLGFREFALDAVSLLGHLGIQKCAVVGWSDGGITGFQIALTKPEILKGLFAFGANTDLDGLKPGGAKATTFRLYAERCRKEYAVLSANPELWPAFMTGLRGMWRSQPNFTSQQLSTIRIPVAVADGDHDEIIKQEHNNYIARAVPNAKLSILRNASHFAFLQDSVQFNERLTEFLRGVAD